jgi:N6-L-threonylcarbamoyladenine synthase
MSASPLILGIETSCDETSAAVVAGGSRILSNVVLSQVPVHEIYGGVVPELASREHLRGIVPTVRQSLERAGVDLSALSGIAVTYGPGLVGCLLVGLTYAKSLTLATGLPLIRVNHLEGHIHAVLLEERNHDRPDPPLPAVALVVSGGHTSLYRVERRAGRYCYELLGKTRDDAAGEAFDKVAKLLGLGYPGGPLIDRLAPHGNPASVSFSRPRMKGNALDFSFSGIKTAVLRYIQTHGMEAAIETRRAAVAKIARPALEDWLKVCEPESLDLLAGFQQSVVAELVEKTMLAVEQSGAESIFATGGVAANRQLRAAMQERAAEVGLPVFTPALSLCTDNAAMIAAAAYPYWQAGEFAGLDLPAYAQLGI